MARIESVVEQSLYSAYLPEWLEPQEVDRGSAGFNMVASIGEFGGIFQLRRFARSPLSGSCG